MGTSRQEVVSQLHTAVFDAGFALEIRTSRKISQAKAGRTNYDESIDMYCSCGILIRGDPDRSNERRKHVTTKRKTKKEVEM